MDKETFVAALVMLEWKHHTPIHRTPTVIYKNHIEIQVYQKTVIVRLPWLSTNFRFGLDLDKVMEFIDGRVKSVDEFVYRSSVESSS